MTGLAAREESGEGVGMEGGKGGVRGRGNMRVRVNKALSTHTNTHTHSGGPKLQRLYLQHNIPQNFYL